MRSVESSHTIVADGAGVVLFGTLGVAWHREQRGVNGEPFPKMTLHERGHVQVAKYLLGDWPYCVYGVGYERAQDGIQPLVTVEGNGVVTRVPTTTPSFFDSHNCHSAQEIDILGVSFFT